MRICGCGNAKSYGKPIANLRICSCGTPLADMNLRYPALLISMVTASYVFSH